MASRIVGIGNHDQMAAVWAGQPCFGRKRKQLHIRSPKHGHWIVSMTDKQAAAFLDAISASVSSVPICILTEEVPNETT